MPTALARIRLAWSGRLLVAAASLLSRQALAEAFHSCAGAGVVLGRMVFRWEVIGKQ